MMKQEINPTWAFKSDEVQAWAYQKEFLSKIECEKIIKYANNLSKNKGSVFGSGRNDINFTYRDSDITWLYPNQDTDWLYRKLVDTITMLNNTYFKFHISHFAEGLQFTNYKAPKGAYKKHVDRMCGINVRKLSLSIQLTDPKDYKGGDLILYEDEKGIKIIKEQGTLILFPSYVMHEVTKVTKGERNSLVAWITGDNFK